MHRGLEAAAHAAVQGDSGVKGVQGSALYAMASFFNHSCCPNVQTWHPGALECACNLCWITPTTDNGATVACIAARDIAPYEQLTISYIDNDAPVQQRQHQLHWGYGFHCSCPVCQEELDDEHKKKATFT